MNNLKGWALMAPLGPVDDALTQSIKNSKQMSNELVDSMFNTNKHLTEVSNNMFTRCYLTVIDDEFLQNSSCKH